MTLSHPHPISPNIASLSPPISSYPHFSNHHTFLLSSPFQDRVWTSCKQAFPSATHSAAQAVPGGTVTLLSAPVIWLPFTSMLGSGSRAAWSKQVESMSWGSSSLQMLTFGMPLSWFSQKSCLEMTASIHKYPTPYLHQPNRSHNPRACLYIAFFWINCIWRS